MDYESNSWIWEGVYYYPRVFGGLMVTAALMGLSTSYFGGIRVPYLPLSSPWSNLGIFHKKRTEKSRVRVYNDGCFDLMHYGHANALRQAKALGDELVVGLVNDEEIMANKGPPVLSMEERLALVSGLKWVDEVITDAPYAIIEQFLNRLFHEYNIDYVIHGDDPCLLPDGTDAFAAVKKCGRYKEIKRTEGVSSTDIVGFERPSAIQQMGIVAFCKGLELIQQAQSGTGKTATFCSGILDVVFSEDNGEGASNRSSNIATRIKGGPRTRTQSVILDSPYVTRQSPGHM